MFCYDEAMNFETFKHRLEQRVIEWFQTQEKTVPSQEARLLLERMSELISRGGKRIRPQLLYLTYVAYGGKDVTALIELGLALEFHHQFLLTHDDIMDRDIVRYDGPNITGYYLQDTAPRQDNIPQAMGLLAGDLLFSFSNEAIINNKKLADKEKVALLSLLHDTNINVGYGQQLDVLNIGSVDNFTEEKLIQIHTLKAALYSTQLPMLWAATLLGLSATEKKKIQQFAEPFGIFFQLVDDYSDYFTNNSAFNNRPKYRDIREGKVTYPFYAALALAKPEDVAVLKHSLGNKKLPDTSIKKVITILEKCGAQKVSQEFAQQYFIQATAALQNLAIDVSARRNLTIMMDQYQI